MRSVTFYSHSLFIILFFRCMCGQRFQNSGGWAKFLSCYILNTCIFDFFLNLGGLRPFWKKVVIVPYHNSFFSVLQFSYPIMQIWKLRTFNLVYFENELNLRMHSRFVYGKIYHFLEPQIEERQTTESKATSHYTEN
jgi:hypothetical protein